MTPMVCVAVSPSLSLAITFIVALPVLSDVIVTLLPDTLAVATLVFNDEAVYLSVSPSGSVNLSDTSTICVCLFLKSVTELIEPFF